MDAKPKLWAKRGKWRLWEIREVSIPQFAIEVALRGYSAIGIPQFYAVLSDGNRIYYPEPTKYVEIEEAN